MNKKPFVSKIKSETSSTDTLQYQITQLREELSSLKKQTQQLLQYRKEDKKETSNLRQSITNILSLLNQPTHLTQHIHKTSKSFQIEDIHSAQVNALIELKNKQIALGSSDGSISLAKVDYDNKTWKLEVNVEHAHDGKIKSLCELNKERFASCGEDKLIKIWDYSIANKLTSTHTLLGHNGSVYKIISLTKDRIASCSPFDHSVKLWEGEHPFNLIQTFQQQNTAASIIQLRKRYEILCINCPTKNGVLNFYDLFPPYNKRGMIEGVKTNTPNGLIELSNGNLAASRGCFPTPCIYIVDPFRYVKVAEIVDNEYILKDGPLCVWGNDSFIFSHWECFCEISYVDGEYKIVYKDKNNKDPCYGGNSVLIVNDGKSLVVANGFKGFNVLNYE